MISPLVVWYSFTNEKLGLLMFCVTPKAVQILFIKVVFPAPISALKAHSLRPFASAKSVLASSKLLIKATRLTCFKFFILTWYCFLFKCNTLNLNFFDV